MGSNLYPSNIFARWGRLSVNHCEGSKAELNSAEGFISHRVTPSPRFPPLDLNMGIHWAKPNVEHFFRYLLATVSRILVGLIPRLLKANGTPKSLHSTAWLDGIRGIAAFCVVIHHCSLASFGSQYHSGYGAGSQSYAIQLPILRLLVSGPPQVFIFFVVSGFALSYKPIKLIRSRRFSEFHSTLASLVFRRHSRLFAPAAAITLMNCVLVYFECYGTRGMPGAYAPTREIPIASSLFGQWLRGIKSISTMVDPLDHSYNGYDRNPFDPNLWTLPCEFDMSMLLFAMMLAFSRLRSFPRMTLTFLFMLYSIYYRHQYPFLFASGMFLAELTQDSPAAAQAPVEKLLDGSEKFPGNSNLKRTLEAIKIFRPLALFVFSPHMMSMPGASWGKDSLPAANYPGFTTLARFTPATYGEKSQGFWVPIGSVMMVLSVSKAPFLQAVFTSGPAQYLGRISFALYLIHGPLLWTLGRAMAVHFTENVTGYATDTEKLLGVSLAAAAYFPVTIWLADVASWAVDDSSVRLGRWVYGKLAIS